MAGKNQKRVLCTVIVHVLDEHGGTKPKQVQVNVEEKSVAHALQRAGERVMAQLKGE